MLTVKHPWHGATFGEKAPATVNALIEIPQGSRSRITTPWIFLCCVRNPFNPFVW